MLRRSRPAPRAAGGDARTASPAASVPSARRRSKTMNVTATSPSRCSSRAQSRSKSGRPPSPQATSSPSSSSPRGIGSSSGSSRVIAQPLRLRTRNAPSVETRARKPSHFTSDRQPAPTGSGPVRARSAPGVPQTASDTDANAAGAGVDGGCSGDARRRSMRRLAGDAAAPPDPRVLRDAC
jgi:hypothetical protein